MKNNSAVVVYLYPNAIKYSNCLIESLNRQTAQNFDIILFNDGILNTNIYNFSQLSSWFNISGSPFEIRVKSFDILKALDYDNFIFLDADDSMTDNRVEVMLRWLSTFSIVCNELNLMNDSGDVFEFKIWSNRLTNGYKFDANFLTDKNLVGFGNVALKRELLMEPIQYKIAPKISDWFVFYQILARSKKQAVFTNECQTNYRQHTSNTAGIVDIDKARIEYVLSVMVSHYNALISIGFSSFSKNISQIEKIDPNSFNNKNNTVPLWWEEIKIAYENN